MKSKNIISIKVVFLFILVIFSLIGFALVFFPTQLNKIGISPDSVQYIGTARHIIAGAGFTTYNDSPLVLFPPFYPSILAMLGWFFKTDPLLLANSLNALLFSLIIGISGILAFKLTQKSIIFSSLALLAIVFSIPLYGVTTMAWTETLFIFFIMSFFLAFSMYALNHRIIPLIILAMVSAFAWLTRYAGVVLVFVGMMSIFIHPALKTKEKIHHICIFISLSSLPIGIWFIRNYLISSTFTGHRDLSNYSLVENIRSILTNISGWFLPNEILHSRFLIALVIVVIALVVGLSQREIKIWKNFYYPLPFALTVFIFLYGLFLLVSSISSFEQLIDNRYLSPIFIPMTLLFFSWQNAIKSISHGRISLIIVFSISVVFSLVFVSHQVKTTLSNKDKLPSFRLGFNTRTELQNDTIRYLIEHPSLVDNCEIYTNHPVAVDFIAYFPAVTTPSKGIHYYSSMVIDDISQLYGLWPMQKACLVWLNSHEDKKLYALSDLKKVITLEEIVSFSDGSISYIYKK